MRVRRHKGFRRSLKFYSITFGIKQPYKVLVDGTFVTQAVNNRINVKEQLPKILNNCRCTPMVTNCMLEEVNSLGPRGRGAAFVMKSYYRVKCGHQTNIGASACIKEQIGKKNERKLFVATQDLQLATHLRAIPGAPVIRMNQMVPFLEEPSDASKKEQQDAEAKKETIASWEAPKLPALRQQKVMESIQNEQPKKKKGPKGVNPLSCKKPKKEKRQDQPPAPKAQPAQETAPPPKAKRTRSRKMGTVTKAEAEKKLQEATTAPEHKPAEANDEEEVAVRSRNKRRKVQ
mmetsp:Transcript_82259/g.172223  ORF Transcript_82259/g.172223 Transcript_82259/m.172223 type:complete len:289 (+) Transcript_82259:233-1099(+)